MAVTLTLEQLADHLRLDRVAIASGDPRRTILVELLQAGTERVELYAPDARTDTQNLAVTVFAAYIFDGPPQRGGAPGATNAFVFSGARAMLAPWRVPGSAVVGDGGVSTTTPTVTTPTTPVVPDMTRYFAVKATDNFNGADFLAGEEFDENGDIVIPAFPMGINWVYFGVAVEHGKTVTQYLFSPDQFAQVTTANWDPANPTDVIIGGESYSFWSSGRYNVFVVGEVLRITVEDV